MKKIFLIFFLLTAIGLSQVQSYYGKSDTISTDARRDTMSILIGTSLLTNIFTMSYQYSILTDYPIQVCNDTSFTYPTTITSIYTSPVLLAKYYSDVNRNVYIRRVPGSTGVATFYFSIWGN